MSGEHVRDTIDPPSQGRVPRALRPMPGHAHGREVTDLRRAVIELAMVRGWHVPQAAANTGPLPGLLFAHPVVLGSEIGWPDLTLVRRRDQRLVFAALATDRATTVSPRRRLVLDLLSSLRWNPSERLAAEQALRRAVPTIETFIWRPADLHAGRIDDVLR